jgi:hypothetical protein
LECRKQCLVFAFLFKLSPLNLLDTKMYTSNLTASKVLSVCMMVGIISALAITNIAGVWDSR